MSADIFVFFLLLLLVLLIAAVLVVGWLQRQQQVVQHYYVARHGRHHRRHHQPHWWRRGRGARYDEGFVAFEADAALQSAVILPLYSPSKSVLKVFDSLFFDATNGNLIEVIGPAAGVMEQEPTTTTQTAPPPPPENTPQTPTQTAPPPPPPPEITPQTPLPLPPPPLPNNTIAPPLINESESSKTGFRVGGRGEVDRIVVTTRANRSAKYDQPTGDNAVVGCPESLINTVDASRAWFTYFTSAELVDDASAYAVFYAAWDTATYLHVIDRTTNAAVCSHRIAPGDQHVLLYTNATITFVQANPNPQFQQQQRSSTATTTTTSVPGYPNAVYRLSSTGFLDPANGYLVLANPGAGQVAQYDRSGNNVVSATVPTSAVPADTFVGWSVVQAADLFIYLALGNETVVMQVQNSGTVAAPRYTLVNVNCYIVGGTDAVNPTPTMDTAAANTPPGVDVTAPPPPGVDVTAPTPPGVDVTAPTPPGVDVAAPTPPDDVAASPPDDVHSRVFANKWFARIPNTTTNVPPPPPPPPPPPSVPSSVPAPAPVAAVSSDLDPRPIKQSFFSSGSSSTERKHQKKEGEKEEEEVDDDANKKKKPRRVEGVDPRSAFGAMVRKPSNYKPTLASVVF